MQSIKKAIYAANNIFLYIAVALMLLMMFVTVADVILRAFAKPIPGVFELTRYALAVIVFASLGFSQINKMHIAIDLVVTRLPKLAQRVIDVFDYLLASVLFSLSFWQMMVYAMRLYDNNLFTTVLRWPVYPWVFVSAFGVLFFVLVLYVDLAGAVRRLIKGGETL